MPIIEVLIFRGTGGVFNKQHPFYSEKSLVRAGHVGVIGIIENKIVGFHPTEEAAEKAGSEEQLIEALNHSEAQPACLQDDNEYFERAYELIEATNGRTTVYTYGFEVSEEIFKEIQAWYNEKREALYNFPDDDGEFEQNESNCAMFWTRFGIELPVITGSIKLLTEQMKQKGYDTWESKKSES
jgi:hypothetical protein